MQSVPLCRFALNETNHPSSAIYETSEVLAIKNYSLTSLYVKGTSMLPTIQDNSRCLCIKKKEYGTGDIILFILRYNGKNMAIVHRVNSINGDEITTKGDNNNFTDPVIVKEDVVCSVPYVPRYFTFIK